jgi:predicted small secreted protein
MSIRRTITTALLAAAASFTLAGCNGGTDQGVDQATTCQQWGIAGPADHAAAQQIINDAKPGTLKDAMVQYEQGAADKDLHAMWTSMDAVQTICSPSTSH